MLVKLTVDDMWLCIVYIVVLEGFGAQKMLEMFDYIMYG